MPERNQSLGEKIDELLELSKDRNTHDSTQQRAFDTLYDELKQYKEDFLFQAEKPLLLDMLLFYDSLHWFQQSLKETDMSPEVISDSFQYLVDEFLELLYRRDVIPCEPSEKFDRRVHKAVKLVPAARSDDDWRIEAILKRGFLRGDCVLRPEEVSVARYGSNDSGTEPKTE